jgi:hypothetical protein
MTQPLAKAIADRRFGIGCDQLILLEPSTVADLKMRIWNHDGGEVQSCGNASRCVVALTGAKTLETGGGIVTGDAADNGIEVSIGQPKFAWDEVPLTYPMDTDAVPLGWGPLEKPIALSVGNPHLVFFVPDVDKIDLVSLGPSIEHDPAFPERINVNVAAVLVPDAHLHVGDYRGFEQDQLVAADAEAAVGERFGQRVGHGQRHFPRIEDSEIIAEAMHLVECARCHRAGHLGSRMGLVHQPECAGCREPPLTLCSPSCFRPYWKPSPR